MAINKAITANELNADPVVNITTNVKEVAGEGKKKVVHPSADFTGDAEQTTSPKFAYGKPQGPKRTSFSF